MKSWFFKKIDKPFSQIDQEKQNRKKTQITKSKINEMILST